MAPSAAIDTRRTPPPPSSPHSPRNTMAEGTYEYECMRAELLGVEKPDYDEFAKRQKEREAREVEEEQADTECLTNSAATNPTLNNISGRLDELNTILASTQRHISRFKLSCGTFTDMIRSKIGRQNNNSKSSLSLDTDDVPAAASVDKCSLDESSQRKSDLCRAMDGNIDKLDSLLDKAESAHYGMMEQRKEMNKFL